MTSPSVVAGESEEAFLRALWNLFPTIPYDFHQVDPAIAEIVFNGIDGNECEAFISAVRDLAWARGRERDYFWMLNLATTRLRGNALRWHAKLDRNIQEDWHSFIRALFEEYPPVRQQ